jgi:uncharacterized protein YaaQ
MDARNGGTMDENSGINLLTIAIVTSEQINELMQELNKSKFYFTRIDSSGGILERDVISLLIGINNSRVDALLSIINRCCYTHTKFIPARVEASMMQSQPLMIEAEFGGATLYALEVDQFVQF